MKSTTSIGVAAALRHSLTALGPTTAVFATVGKPVTPIYHLLRRGQPYMDEEAGSYKK